MRQRFAYWLGLVSVAAACGRPATLEDCEEIVQRVTVLEVKKRQPGADPQSLKAEAEREIVAQREAMQKQCVGKRITDGILRCVRDAKSSEEVLEECF